LNYLDEEFDYARTRSTWHHLGATLFGPEQVKGDGKKGGVKQPGHWEMWCGLVERSVDVVLNYCLVVPCGACVH
jgi:hypothetical protein